ncbi:MAG: type VI secretion system tip protein VgrG [Cellvibrionaceae bacterium]|nr:type VI secretion system tip protein VgrG [Cellvibrionaceae bacterium]
MAPKQDNRLIHIKTPLSKDTFIATSINGSEAINALFSYDVKLMSDNHEVGQQDLVGKSVTVSIRHNGPDRPRFIHAYVSHLSLMDVNAEGMRSYSVNLVPGFWFTRLASNNRVFHEMSVKDILQSVLGEYNKVLKTDIKLNRSYFTREYCVQFDETDFEFACRLMSEEGINYYFEHSDGSHKMIICDHSQSFFECDTDPVEYDGGGSQPTKETVSQWDHHFNYHVGGFEFKDYCEFTPSKDNKIQVNTTTPLNDSSAYTLRQYGLNQFKKDQHKHQFQNNTHKQLNEDAMEHQESGFNIAQGSGNCCAFTAGGTFQLDHPLSTEKGQYLITQLSLFASDGHGTPTRYSNKFSCIPAKVFPRPDHLGFKKRVPYPQVAEVLEVKAAPSERSDDLFTQVKVKFPWNSEQNSCWVRVMQQFAGKNWGANFVPRIGQEVVVSYINGDPDRPLITGAVYNGTNTGPNYTATQSGWKTEYENSEFNELRFDDKKDNEEIYMEAGKDHNWLVHNDQSGKVENDQTLEVKNNRSITVTDGNESIVIAKGNQDTKIGGNQSSNVDGNRDTKVKGNHSEKVTGSQNISATKGVKIESPTSIELKVGGNSVKLTPAGIEIKGIMVKVNGSAMAEVKAGGMLTLKGGITMIN